MDSQEYSNIYKILKKGNNKINIDIILNYNNDHSHMSQEIKGAFNSLLCFSGFAAMIGFRLYLRHKLGIR